MAFLGLGKPRKLEDLKIDDLRRERVKQEMEQDMLLTAIQRAQQEYDRLLEMASEPGVNDAERNVAAYRMSHASPRGGCWGRGGRFRGSLGLEDQLTFAVRRRQTLVGGI